MKLTEQDLEVAKEKVRKRWNFFGISFSTVPKKSVGRKKYRTD